MGRRRTLVLDSLERRDLLSITMLINSPSWVQATATGGGSSTGSTGQGSNGTSSSSSPIQQNPATGIYEDTASGGSGITTDVTPPLPNEVARRNFTAKFSGKVVEEPPRLQDQSRQFYFLGNGTSTAFLHGTAQVRYYTPNPNPVTFPDPTNPTGPMITEHVTATTGTISMSDRSTQSGTVILADLVGSPTAVDSKGRPTEFALTVNGGGGSGGIYASSTGTGTVSIAYHGNKATFTVQASIFRNGIGNPYDIYQGITL